MIPRKATAIVFLCFAVVVAFYNALLKQFQYIPLTIPFILAVLLKGRPSQMAESFGVTAAALYILVDQILHIGIMGLLVASAMFFTLGLSRRVERIYLYSITGLVFLASLVRNDGYPAQPLRGLLDAGLYLICAFCIYVSIQNHTSEIKNDKPLPQKYIEVLEHSVKIAKDAIEVAKRGALNE